MMVNYLIKDLNLCPSARKVLDKLRIKTTDELRYFSMWDLNRKYHVRNKAYSEILQLVDRLWKEAVSERVLMEYSAEQLVEMAAHSVDELALSDGSSQVLKKYNLQQVDEVALLTEDDYASFEGASEKCMDEIQEAVKNWAIHHLELTEIQEAYFKRNDRKNEPENNIYLCPYPLTDDLLNALGRCSTEEMRRNGSSGWILEDYKIETVAQLAVFERDTLYSIRYIRKKVIQEIEEGLYASVYDNYLKKTGVSGYIRSTDRYLRVMGNCARMLTPLCKVSSGQLYTLFQMDEKLELLDQDGDEESTFHNYLLALTLDGLKEHFCSLWSTILPENVDYIERAEEKLQSMNITSVTDFVKASLQKQYILKKDNQFVLNCKYFMGYYTDNQCYVSLTSLVLELCMKGKSIEKIASLWFGTKESAVNYSDL